MDRSLSGTLRDRLARLADRLIPGGEGMPSAAQAEVAGRQLDLVLRARPDLLPILVAALGEDPGNDPARWLDRLQERNPAGHEAVILAVVGGYYMHPDVRAALDYPGQTPQVVSIAFPEYVAEGLLERVLQRGPIYRLTPGWRLRAGE